MPALQCVLDLQPQLRRQVPQIDAGGSDQFAVGDEAVGVGPAVTVPPVVVACAEEFRGIGDPEVAERQPALGGCAVARGQVRGIPAGQVGLAGPAPPVAVLGAQAVLGAASVAAAGDDAGSQGSAAPRWRAGISQEVRHRRAAVLAEPDRMGIAESAPDRRCCPVAVRDRALVGGEHGVVRGGDVDLGAELGPDDGHQPLKQPRSSRRLLSREGHSRTSRPVNQPAASSVRRASSTVR